MHPTHGFNLSRHAIDRLFERHPLIFARIPEGENERRSVAYRVLQDATIDKRFINDTRFMVYLREKYGFDNDLSFFRNGDVLFVGLVKPEYGFINKIITTTMAVCTQQSAHLRNVVPKEQTFSKAEIPHKWKVKTIKSARKRPAPGAPAFKKETYRAS